MFDDRMDEELEWVQLDLDEISHNVVNDKFKTADYGGGKTAESGA